MVTLGDIAKASGVGISAVSYALNNTGQKKLSKATRERILRVASELNYVPNIAGRALAKGRTFQVGVLLMDWTSEFLFGIFAGLDSVLEQAGYSVIVSRYSNIAQFRERLRVFANKQIDGMVVFHGYVDALDLLRELNARIPVVTVAMDYGSDEIPSILCSGERGGWLAMRHLLDLGHRCVAVHHNDAGFAQGCLRAAADYPGAEALICTTDQASGAVNFWKWCRNAPGRPTACIAYGDIEAAQLISVIGDDGFSVPKDFSVVGIDGEKIGEIVRPMLTTIYQPCEEQGVMAANALLRRLRGEESASLFLQPRLVVRQSTAVPPA